MKLPGINYKTPVQSLGKRNISGPMQVANAEANALQQFGKIALQTADMIEANDLAEKSADASNEWSELNAEVKNKKYYTIDELDKAGIEYNPTHLVVNKETGKMEPQDRIVVPAHEVSDEYYKKSANEIHDRYSGQLGYRGKKILEKTFASKYSIGIADVIEQRIVNAQEYARTQSNMNFEKSVNAGNEEGAKFIAETSKLTGVWSQAEYADKMGPLSGRISESKYQKQLTNTDNYEELDRLQYAVTNDTVMTASQKEGLVKAYESKMGRVQTATEKRKKAEKVEASSMQYSTTANEMIANNRTLNEDEMQSELRTLLPSDRKSLLSLNKSLKGGKFESDPDSYAIAVRRVEGVTINIGNSTITSRKSMITAELRDMLDAKEINPDDFMALTEKLKGYSEAPFKSTSYKQAEKTMRIILVGGSDDLMKGAFGTGTLALNYAHAMEDMRTSAENLGEDFDARKWWENNQGKYITEAIQDNQAELENDSDRFLMTIGSDGYADVNATRIAMDKKGIDITQQQRVFKKMGEWNTSRRRLKTQQDGARQKSLN